jgi:hypothetical protein
LRSKTASKFDVKKYGENWELVKNVLWWKSGNTLCFMLIFPQYVPLRIGSDDFCH